MPEEDQKLDHPSKRERSPSFPYLDLETSIEHLAKIHTAAKMNEVRLADVAGAWGMAAKSGSVMRYVAALGQYGLIETSGSGDQRRIKVSSEGRRILEDGRPGVRQQLKSDAALKSSIIRGLFYGGEGMPVWGRERPSDSIAESSLKFDLNFGADAARRFLSVYDATIKHIIDGDTANNGVDSVVEEALEADQNEEEIKVKSVQSSPKDDAPRPSQKEHEGALNDIDFQNAGKGKIRISAVLDSEGLDMLEKKIAAFRILIN